MIVCRRFSSDGVLFCWWCDCSHGEWTLGEAVDEEADVGGVFGETHDVVGFDVAAELYCRHFSVVGSDLETQE